MHDLDLMFKVTIHALVFEEYLTVLLHVNEVALYYIDQGADMFQ